MSCVNKANINLKIRQLKISAKKPDYYDNQATDFSLMLHYYDNQATDFYLVLHYYDNQATDFSLVLHYYDNQAFD